MSKAVAIDSVAKRVESETLTSAQCVQLPVASPVPSVTAPTEKRRPPAGKSSLDPKVGESLCPSWAVTAAAYVAGCELQYKSLVAVFISVKDFSKTESGTNPIISSKQIIFS
jgi:hypothetical protein